MEYSSAAALVDALRGKADQVVERDYLEIKSVQDWDAETLAKIAKFILAAGNRTSFQTQFEGRAVMVLGLDSMGVVTGVPKRDDHQLRDPIKSLLPRRSPEWDFVIVSDQATGHHVVVIHVKPGRPGDRAFFAERDSASLHDGMVYVRSGSQTRPAKASELHALLDRELMSQKPQLRVELATPIAPSDLVDRLGAGIREAKRDLLVGARRSLDEQQEVELAHPLTRNAALVRQALEGSLGSLSRTPSWQEIEDWELAFKQHWDHVGHDWVGLLWPAVELTITNESSTYLTDVDVDVLVPAGLFAIPHRDIHDWWQSMRGELPGLRNPWSLVPLPLTRNTSLDHSASATNLNSGVRITVHVPRVPPLSSQTIPTDFILCADTPRALEFPAEWTMTARGHDDRYEGRSVFRAGPKPDITGAVNAVMNDNPDAVTWE